MFFCWLESITSIRAVGGGGLDLEITFSTRRKVERDLREIIAVFHRYAIDKRVLRQFDSARLVWFRDRKKYWHKEIFGRRSRDAKRP